MVKYKIVPTVNNMVLYMLKHIQRREVMLNKKCINFISKLNIGSSLKKGGLMQRLTGSLKRILLRVT